jgi:hypothetical protein
MTIGARRAQSKGWTQMRTTVMLSTRVAMVPAEPSSTRIIQVTVGIGVTAVPRRTDMWAVIAVGRDLGGAPARARHGAGAVTWIGEVAAGATCPGTGTTYGRAAGA